MLGEQYVPFFLRRGDLSFFSLLMISLTTDAKLGFSGFVLVMPPLIEC
jgi:hypothetical protein